uniref:ARHGAP32 n=2 Tax=Macrostomum lignano TaxID=282301 RepID=A0A1I8IDC6_9PLAT
MADGGQQRGSSSSGTRPQVEQLLGLRRDGADGGGGSGGGGGLSEESDSGEDNSVTRLWRRAFSGLKLAKDKATKKKKRSSMEDSEGIDPVYSLLKHAADRGTQKCAACCPQSESLSPAGRNSPVCNHAGYSRLADDLTVCMLDSKPVC